MVLDEGYAWNGGVYRSLSQVAKAITGTNWNGHRFFGAERRQERRLEEKRNRRANIERSARNWRIESATGSS